MPDDKLALAAGFVDHRRTVTGLAGRQRTPDLLAGVLVECHGRRALAADHTD